MRRTLFATCVDFLYPATCLCGAAGDSALCGACQQSTPLIRSPMCDICGLPFHARAGSDHPCSHCIQTPPFFRRARACTTYDSLLELPQPVRDAIRRHKYGRQLWIGRPLARILDERLELPPTYDLIVPVPLHLERLRWRGFNQSLLLARHLAQRRHLPLAVDAIERCIATRPQVDLSAGERRANVRRAFRMRHADAVRDKRVLLVDDVMTTGATVNECARVLRRAGAAWVDVAVVARAIS